ncbi:MAG: amidohydrolase [Candidatus Dormibacteraeota bacterium]|nr:amidohydrolase [Candidatus Dormibacteraeota bacterium]
MSADLVFINAEVITMERGRPHAEAVAVAGGRIVAVGATDSVRALANGAQVVDLKGRTLLPGFVEAHGHPTLEIMTVLPPTVDIRPFFVHDHDEVVAKIKETLGALPPGTPQAFYGYDPVLCPGAHKLERGELDAIAPDHPIVVLNNSGHAGYANSRMLAAAGINRDTPDPVGSQYERDSAGEPTGVALETAALIALTKPYFERVMAETSMPDLLRREYEMYARTGVTTASDMAFDRQSRPLFASYSGTSGALTRIVAYEKSDGGLKSDVSPGWGDDMFRQAGIKLWADGSPWIGNIATTFPYMCTGMTEAMGLKCGHIGHANYTPEQIREVCEAYFPGGWQLAIHVHGDAIADSVLDAYEDVLSGHPRPDHRLRMEHCGALRADQYERAGRLGITCSLFPAHIYYFGDALADGLFGEAVAANWVSARSALDAGIKISLHNDAPVTPESPLLNMQTAVTRRARGSGRVLGPEHRITPLEALRAQTIDAAWQLFMEDGVGSITPGKFADLVVLDGNPLATDPERLSELNVVETYLGGRQVHQA